MHSDLPWITGPRTPRPVLPRVWAPAHRRPLDVVILAPFRRLPVHWTGLRHALHFPGSCPHCPAYPTWEEHGYAPALVRWADGSNAEVQGWEHGVAQLTQGPLATVVYRPSDPWIYTLTRNGGPSSMVSTERRECSRHIWLQGRPFDPSPTLERLYGSRWKDATGAAAKLLEDRHAKGGQP
jgi:hypothetical protein